MNIVKITHLVWNRTLWYQMAKDSTHDNHRSKMQSLIRSKNTRWGDSQILSKQTLWIIQTCCKRIVKLWIKPQVFLEHQQIKLALIQARLCFQQILILMNHSSKTLEALVLHLENVTLCKIKRSSHFCPKIYQRLQQAHFLCVKLKKK